MKFEPPVVDMVSIMATLSARLSLDWSVIV